MPGHGVRKAPPEDGVVDTLPGQQQQNGIDQCTVVGRRIRKAQLAPHLGHEVAGEDGFVRLEGRACRALIADQRQQRLRQAKEIPVSHVGLAVVCIAALRVAVVADMAGHEGIQKLERAIVDGQAQDAHVVGVHHAVAKTYGLPVRHERGGALAHGLQQGCVSVAGRLRHRAAGRVIAVDHIVGQGAQLLLHVARGEMLEVAKTDEAGGHAGHDGGGFRLFAAHGGR